MVKVKLIALVALLALLCVPAVAQKTTGHTKGTGHNKWSTGAPAVNLSASTLSFGSVTVNTTSAAQVVTLTNTGTLSLSISSIVTTSPFANTTTCTGTLAAGSKCTISVTFHPTSAVASTGTTTLTDSAQGSPHVINLSGLGGAAAAPIVQLSATSLSFAGQQENTTSTPQTVTMTNVGSAVLNITSIVTSSVFADTTTCAATLAASASCTISVTFTPTGVASYTASTTITDDAANSPQVISLAGSGISAPSFPVVNLSTSAITFANQVVNTTSAASVITLTNVGSASLTISSIAVTGTDAADFAKTTTCGGTLAAGARCTISPTFTPLSAASFSAAITITDNASGSPHVTTLTGTGIAIPPPTVLFQFPASSTAVVPPWDFANGAVTLSTNPTYAHGGNNSAEFHYTGCTDCNVWVDKVITPGHTHVFMRGYVYFRTPAGGLDTAIKQRKIMWESDDLGGGTHTGPDLVLNTWSGAGGSPTPGQLWLQASANESACSGTIPTVWEIYPFSWDTLYSVETELQLNTSGNSDGIRRIWVNGTLVDNETNINLIGTCGTTLTFFSVGRQYENFPGPTDEYRNWSDVIISATGPIGP